ncbi:hypothetical protein [uncultured Aquabacterium sp.]|uniref:hypothetical protein n=1 Tax=uncultured Aquabacterium sp. TaxID=158753 RepID=UPI0025FD4627|nr:hypothetical protein [uncultured Aquabacterium sp.]
MDIRQIRLANYRDLLVAFANSPEEAGASDYGRLKRFATKAGVSDRMLSHINNGRGNLGSDLCRRMEQGLGLPSGWMDQMHGLGDSAGVSDEEQSFLELALQMFRANPLRATKLMADLALSLNSERDSHSASAAIAKDGQESNGRGVHGFTGR